jgi:cobalt-zinc-cadmium efflux system outer membrane protein
MLALPSLVAFLSSTVHKLIVSILLPLRKYLTRPVTRLSVFVASVSLFSGCASTGGGASRADIDQAIRDRTGNRIQVEAGGTPLPAGVSLEDGVSADEAVAVALWNSPAFEATLADLGIAKADLADARLLRNPVLSLLFPVGPKQLEWTLQFAVDAVWQRPRRVAAASLNLQAVGQRLVADGLTLVANVRQAYADAIAAERRVTLAAENVELVTRITAIAEARFRAGDISELEARAARADAAQVQVGWRALGHDRDDSYITLIRLMGLDTPPAELRLIGEVDAPVAACGPPDVLLRDALASRPDLRAAELAIEAAGARASWERARVVNLIAMLDANGAGIRGYEQGPGLSAELPIFARNQGGISRALAEIERASRSYLALRVQIAADIRSALVRVDQAREAIQAWEQDIVPSLQTEARQAETAYQAGEIALLNVLDVNRRLVQARVNRFEAIVRLQRAAISLDRSIGRKCVGR